MQPILQKWGFTALHGFSHIATAAPQVQQLLQGLCSSMVLAHPWQHPLDLGHFYTSSSQQSSIRMACHGTRWHRHILEVTPTPAQGRGAGAARPLLQQGETSAARRAAFDTGNKAVPSATASFKRLLCIQANNTAFLQRLKSCLHAQRKRLQSST